MPRPKPKTKQLLDLARKVGILHARDLKPLGIHQEYLGRLRARGLLERVGRGLYRLPDAEVTAHHTLAEAAKAVPKGIVCLVSALNFHEIGTQIPRAVWLAIDHRAARPRVAYPPLHIVRFSGKSLAEGIETHEVDGVPVRVYSAAKTVVDCFRYRNKIGLDVTLEALREALRGRKCTIDELWRYAKSGRVANVIRPYLEATA